MPTSSSSANPAPARASWRVPSTHGAGARRAFVTINCPSLSADLMESELFGHNRGAFTGATESTLGRVNRADGGTLFLDEIGDFRWRCNPSCCASSGQGIRTRRRPGHPPRRRAHHGGDQPQSRRDGPRGQVPRGPALPPQRHHPQSAADARAPGRRTGLPSASSPPSSRTTGARRAASAMPQWRRSRPIAGPATCANCATWWSGQASSARSR